LSFIALFQAAGIALFVAMLGHLLSASESSLRRIGRASAEAAIILVVLHQLLAAANMTGDFSGLMDASLQLRALQTSAGVANGLRILGLLVTAIALARSGAGWRTAGVAGATLVVMSFLITGHTSSHLQRWWLAPLLLLHLWVVAFWFGSLWPLYAASSKEIPQVAASMVARFSAIAVRLVPVIAIAGVAMAVTLLPNVSALLAPYGLLLLVKATGFAVLLGLATLNKWRLGPALASGAMTAAQLFRRSVMAEYGLICVVLIATAVMTGWFSPET
jgi:putative copper export protein